MKCQKCGHDNRQSSKNCKKCGADMAPASSAPVWFPDWRWHLKTLSVIYLLLIVGFFTAKHFLGRLQPPYNIRQLPSEMTPWLNPKNYPAP